jgi:hypothetical protein
VTLLEHPVLVGGGLRDDLQQVPVLDHLAVSVEPEDVDAGILIVTRPDLVAVQHDVVALASARLNSTRFPGYSAAIRSR